jgi:protein-tyrosine phosphatase
VLDDQPQAAVLIHCTAGRRRSVMVTYAVLRLRGHDRSQAAALLLRYRKEAVLVPAYVRSVEQWLAATRLTPT